MSLPDDLRAVAIPAVANGLDELSGLFLAGVGSRVKDLAHQTKLAGLFKSAADYRAKALTSTNENEARLNLELYQTAVRRIKTIAIAEAIVESEATAAWLSDMAHSILETGARIAKGVLQAVVAGAVSGAITSLTGGTAPAIGGAAGAVVEVLRGR